MPFFANSSSMDERKIMKFILYLFALILGLGGILAGGCGVIFLPVVLGTGPELLFLSVGSIVGGGLALWGAIKIFRNLQDKAALQKDKNHEH